MANDITVVKSNRKYKTLVTDIGNAKQANAVLNGEKVNIVTAVIGDGNGAYYSPSADMTAVLNEVWRGDIANKTINPDSPNMYDVRVVLDWSVGGFTVREVGLLDDQGDLIVIANTPDTPKAVLADGILAPLTIVLHVVFTNTEVIEFTVNPTVDAVDAETLQREIERHNADPKAHAELLKTAGVSLKIGDQEPEDGPALWFNTGAVEKPKTVVFLELGGDSDESDLIAAIAGSNNPVMNADVNGENPDRVEIQITKN